MDAALTTHFRWSLQQQKLSCRNLASLCHVQRLLDKLVPRILISLLSVRSSGCIRVAGKAVMAVGLPYLAHRHAQQWDSDGTVLSQQLLQTLDNPQPWTALLDICTVRLEKQMFLHGILAFPDFWLEVNVTSIDLFRTSWSPTAFGQIPGMGCEELLSLYDIVLLFEGSKQTEQSCEELIQVGLLCKSFFVQVTISQFELQRRGSDVPWAQHCSQWCCSGSGGSRRKLKEAWISFPFPQALCWAWWASSMWEVCSISCGTCARWMGKIWPRGHCKVLEVVCSLHRSSC